MVDGKLISTFNPQLLNQRLVQFTNKPAYCWPLRYREFTPGKSRSLTTAFVGAFLDGINIDIPPIVCY